MIMNRSTGQGVIVWFLQIPIYFRVDIWTWMKQRVCAGPGKSCVELFLLWGNFSIMKRWYKNSEFPDVKKSLLMSFCSDIFKGKLKLN